MKSVINCFRMESKRRVGDGMCFLLLVILGNVSTAVSGQSLDCTNDYDASMFCYFEALNCTGYSLTLRSDEGYGEVNSSLKQCDIGRCCCTFHHMKLIWEESHTATVWKGGKSMESKIISITTSIKPKTPTITSVKESNGNFLIRWKTNYVTSFSESLAANVTYYKKGDTETQVPEFKKPKKVDDGLNEYEIPGQFLEPSTTYAVSVKSYTDWSNKYSDSSPVWEFTTPVSPFVLPLAVILSLSIAAAIISGAIYVCTVKLKTKWWDTVARSPNPKLLDMFPSVQEVLKPVPPIISLISVEPLDSDDGKPWLKESTRDTNCRSPQQSSESPQQGNGISVGPFCLSDTNTEAGIIVRVQDALGKALANISPISPLITNPQSDINKDSALLSSACNPCSVPADDVSSGISCFDNKTYSIPLPNCQNQFMTESQSAILCDSSYHPSTCDTVTCVDQQVRVGPTMPYQPRYVDSGGFSYDDDSSCSTVSNGDPESGAEASCERFDEAVSGVKDLHENTEGSTVSERNPCYGCMPAGSNSFPPVDNDYQAIQNLVEKPEILEEPFHQDAFLTPVAPSLLNNDQGEECLSELQRPFPSLLPADQSMPLIADSGYQSV